LCMIVSTCKKSTDAQEMTIDTKVSNCFLARQLYMYTIMHSILLLGTTMDGHPLYRL